MAWDLGIPNENWGMSGIGNVGIFHRLVECDLKNKFDSDDLILILWSHWNREDRYQNQWQAHGNVFHEGYYSNLAKKYWSLDNDIIKNSTAIISANKMYNINFQSNIMPLLAFESNPKNLTEKEKQLFEFYKQSIPDKSCFEYDSQAAFNCYQYDDHPTVLQHLNYLRNQVYPSLNLEIKDTTVEVCNSIHEDIIKICPLPENKDISLLLAAKIKRKYNLSYRQPVGF
jgi:hypothetical protein